MRKEYQVTVDGKVTFYINSIHKPILTDGNDEDGSVTAIWIGNSTIIEFETHDVYIREFTGYTK